MSENSHDSRDLNKRRKRLRYNINVQVEFVGKNLSQAKVEKTANISLGGLFLRTDYPAEVNERLFLRVIFKDKEAYFDVKGRVAWISDGEAYPYGFGVEFVDLTDAQNYVIEKYLKDYTTVK